MHAKGVRHIRDLVLAVAGLAQDLWWRVVAAADVVLVQPPEERFLELAAQQFHHAVGVGVVVDGRALARCPNQHQQVALPVAPVHEVPGVRAAVIGEGVRAPLSLLGAVAAWAHLGP